MVPARMNATRQVNLALCLAWILALGALGAANAAEVDLVLVGTTAGQTAEIVDRIALTAHSANGDSQALEAFQGLGSEAAALLAEIEEQCLAGRDLSVTRPQFVRVVQIVDFARHVIEEAKIYVNPADEKELLSLLSLLDQQYSPRRELPGQPEIPTDPPSPILP